MGQRAALSLDAKLWRLMLAAAAAGVIAVGLAATAADLIVLQRTLDPAAGFAPLRERLLADGKFLACALVGVLLATQALRAPLRRLIDAPARHLLQVLREGLQKKNFSLRASKAEDDEFGQMADALNELFVELERRDRTLNQFQAEFEQRVRDRT